MEVSSETSDKRTPTYIVPQVSQSSVLCSDYFMIDAVCNDLSQQYEESAEADLDNRPGSFIVVIFLF